MYIIGNGILITRNKNNDYFDNGAVVIDNNLIIDYGETSQIKEKYICEFIDVKGQVIMPGLINTHLHIYSAFARGINIKNSTPNKNFNDILNGLWWKVDKTLNLEDVKYSAYTTLIDCIKNGVTTVFDHHASQNYIENSLFTIASVCKELNIRASLCYEITDRDGEERTDKAIKENFDFIKYANSENSDMIKGMIGLHASFTVSDETLDKCIQENKDIKAGYHVHTAEDIFDEEDSLKKYGKTVVQRFYDKGILSNKTICVHGVHINEKEMDLIKETDTIMVHNPESNMGNAVGTTPIFDILNKNILIGLGTDGYTTDMFESYKVGNLVHKMYLKDSNVAWGEIPTMLFNNNSEICRRFFNNDIGIIEKEAKADIIIVDYDPLTPMTKDNINSHILFGMMGRNTVSTVINGKFVMKDREILVCDEKEIFKKSREISKKFWERINA